MKKLVLILFSVSVLPFSAFCAGSLVVGDGEDNIFTNVAGPSASAVLDAVYVGINGGNGNALQVSGQTTLNYNILLIGENGNRNRVVVSDSGTSLYGRYLLGLAGMENSLVVTNGGAVFGGGVIGHFGNEDNRVEVSGAGSRISTTGDLTVGFRAAYNTFSVSNGGNAQLGNVGIGYSDGFRYSVFGNAVNVSGSSSEVTTAHMEVGGYSTSGSRLRLNDGAIMASSSALISSDLSGNNGVEISGNGAQWTVSGNLEMISSDPLPELEDNFITIESGGTLIAESGLTMRSDDGGRSANTLNINNEGKLVIGTDFQPPETGFNLNAGGTLTVRGQLRGFSILPELCRLETASLLGNLNVSGTFAPGTSPAESLLDGDLTLMENGLLEMEILGYQPGTEYDRLTVTGLAQLDGKLDLLNIGNVVITNGASFDLFNWNGGTSGTFASINTPELDGGLFWDSSELYSSGTMSVIPEPASAILLLIAGGILYAKKRFFFFG